MGEKVARPTPHLELPMQITVLEVRFSLLNRVFVECRRQPLFLPGRVLPPVLPGGAVWEIRSFFSKFFRAAATSQGNDH